MIIDRKTTYDCAPTLTDAEVWRPGLQPACRFELGTYAINLMQPGRGLVG
jgi:hypothetical protein